ncbi:MAG: hypothetical protein ACPGXZ_07390 [Saprospiraceae bacterium]
MKNLLLIVICFFSIGQLEAQNDAPISFSLSYFGESVIHPGLKIGIEKPFYTKEKVKKRWLAKRQERLGAKVSKSQLIWGANVGFYNHPNNNTGLFLNGELSWKKTKMRKGSMFGAGLGIGYLHQFHNIDTYRLNNGQLEKVSAAGQAMMTSSFSLLYGRDLSVRHNSPFSWYVKPSFMIQFPYHHSTGINAALELGVKYKLSKGVKSK